MGTPPSLPPDRAFPPQDDAAALAAVAALAEGVAGTLGLARALAAGRRRIALDGLDGMVGLLCAQALDLPPAQGRLIRPRLEALLAELDALGESLAPT